MGFDCAIKETSTFTYYLEVDHNLFEHEYNHAYVGVFDGDPNPLAAEVSAWKWANKENLSKDIQAHPELYTSWFRELLPGILTSCWF